MSNDKLSDNGVNETGTTSEGVSPGRYSSAQERGTGRYQATARMQWTKQVNIVVMECYYRNRPVDENGIPIRGYRRRMFREWRERGMFESTEQRISDQARAIRKNGWLSELELETIRRRIEQEGEETHEMENVTKSADIDQNVVNEKVDKKRLEEETRKVNKAIKHVAPKDITESNNLMKAASIWVARQLGLKKPMRGKKVEPWWKRRIEGDIKRIRWEVNILEREKRGEIKSKRKVKELENKYNIKRKGLTLVIEELKQKLLAKTAKINRYEQRITQYRQNQMFETDQKKVYEELNSEFNGESVIPDKRVRAFGMPGYPNGRTVLCQKDPANSIAVDNFRPISCLPLMWKLTTGILADNMYDYFERERILPEEQKGCRKGRRGTKDQLLIDKAILKDCRKIHKNLAMAWIDYRKAYDMVPHSWIVECLEMFGIAENVKKFLIDSMKTWKTELTSSGESLGVIHIRRGIFQGDSLSPLLFVKINSRL
ncbi:uncharacterized protein [Montipora foliosa]|uniref:uncharacterized protein n=1 Tax=Montipora foliosa TaxID=591990 RepID=UPI0035F1E941